MRPGPPLDAGLTFDNVAVDWEKLEDHDRIQWQRVALAIGAAELATSAACVGYGLVVGDWIFWLAAALLAVVGTWNLVAYRRSIRRV
jgi:hypothetical protein